MGENQEKMPAKLTITYQDGTTETPEVFVAIVARGLLPDGEHEGHKVYRSTDDLSVVIVCSIAADPATVVGLLEGLTRAEVGILSSVKDDPAAAAALIVALHSLRPQDRPGGYEKKEIVRRPPRRN